jgi:hypothetical protein
MAEPDKPKVGWRARWRAWREERKRKEAERIYRGRGSGGRGGGSGSHREAASGGEGSMPTGGI